MSNKAVVKVPTYKELVLAQVRELSQNFVEGYNPAAFPISSNYRKEKEGSPRLWELPFAEKPVQPTAEDMHHFSIDEEIILIAMGVPRQFASVYIEREIIPVNGGYETLIERVFYRYTEMFAGVVKFVAANSIYFETRHMYDGSPRLKISSQIPSQTGISKFGDMPVGKTPRDFLKEPKIPFAAPMSIG